jgi:hypothetical protein
MSSVEKKGDEKKDEKKETKDEKKETKKDDSEPGKKDEKGKLTDKDIFGDAEDPELQKIQEVRSRCVAEDASLESSRIPFQPHLRAKSIACCVSFDFSYFRLDFLCRHEKIRIELCVVFVF